MVITIFLNKISVSLIILLYVSVTQKWLCVRVNACVVILQIFSIKAKENHEKMTIYVNCIVMNEIN